MNTRVPSDGMLSLYSMAEGLSWVIKNEPNKRERQRLLAKRRELGEKIIAAEKIEDEQFERNRANGNSFFINPPHQRSSHMSAETIQIIRKFECDEHDAKVIVDLLKQADDAGFRGAFGEPSQIEKHAEFEDSAGLDLQQLDVGLLLDDGTLLKEFRKRYALAYGTAPVTRKPPKKSTKKPN
jgi:hypothetical protein